MADSISWADEVTQSFQQCKGSDEAPAGTYFCTRTLGIWQQTKDGVLPTTETFALIEDTGAASFAEIASAVNAVTLHEGYGTSFTAASFGVYEARQP